ncbi:MAG: hypothetical protein HC888_15705 [Candidatus Competibacteraceae bacterium]|nr:hypothetical protein [Candidatus Competibacteraceae bacterium]
MGGIVDVIASDDVQGTVVKEGKRSDLIVLGLGQTGKKRLFGDLVQTIVKQCDRAIVLIGQKE